MARTTHALDTMCDEVDALVARMAELWAEAPKLAERVAERTAAVAECEAVDERLSAELTALQLAVAQEEEEVARLHDRLQQDEHAVCVAAEMQAAERARVSASIEAVTRECERQEAAARALQQRYAAAQEAVALQTAELQQRTREAASLMQEKKELTARIATAESKCAAYKEAAASARTRMTDTEAALNSITLEQSRARLALRAVLSRCTAHANSLRSASASLPLSLQQLKLLGDAASASQLDVTCHTGGMDSPSADVLCADDIMHTATRLQQVLAEDNADMEVQLARLQAEDAAIGHEMDASRAALAASVENTNQAVRCMLQMGHTAAPLLLWAADSKHAGANDVAGEGAQREVATESAPLTASTTLVLSMLNGAAPLPSHEQDAVSHALACDCVALALQHAVGAPVPEAEEPGTATHSPSAGSQQLDLDALAALSQQVFNLMSVVQSAGSKPHLADTGAAASAGDLLARVRQLSIQLPLLTSDAMSCVALVEATTVHAPALQELFNEEVAPGAAAAAAACPALLACAERVRQLTHDRIDAERQVAAVDAELEKTELEAQAAAASMSELEQQRAGAEQEYRQRATALQARRAELQSGLDSAQQKLCAAQSKHEEVQASVKIEAAKVKAAEAMAATAVSR
ncbi:MAG: hypothetical protein EOO41_00980, partial [Methanobacteriota archaeon]